jgi:hypothetical protein
MNASDLEFAKRMNGDDQLGQIAKNAFVEERNRKSYLNKLSSD